MSPPPDQHRPPASDIDAGLLDADGRVRRDVLCVECRYNLRTLPWDGRCPECNRPITESLRPSSLAVGSSRWLWRLNSGCGLLVTSLGLVSVSLFGATFRHDAASLLIFAPFGLLFWAIGAFQVTAPNPDQVDREPRVSVRRLTRVALLALVLLGAAAIPAFRHQVPAAIVIGLLVALDAAAVLPILLLLTLRDIATHARLKRIAARFGRTIWVQGAAAICIILFILAKFAETSAGSLAAGVASILLMSVGVGFWLAALIPLTEAIDPAIRRASRRADAARRSG